MSQQQINDENEIMIKMKDVYSKLTDYNTAYYNCANNASFKTDCNINTNKDFKTLYDNLKDSLKKLEDLINNYKKNYNIIDNVDFNQIKTDYNKILENRKELDAKLTELYGAINGNDSLYNNQNHVDSAILSGVLWTILATSMLYYIFIRL